MAGLVEAPPAGARAPSRGARPGLRDARWVQREPVSAGAFEGVPAGLPCLAAARGPCRLAGLAKATATPPRSSSPDAIAARTSCASPRRSDRVERRRADPRRRRQGRRHRQPGKAHWTSWPRSRADRRNTTASPSGFGPRAIARRSLPALRRANAPSAGRRPFRDRARHVLARPHRSRLEAARRRAARRSVRPCCRLLRRLGLSRRRARRAPLRRRRRSISTRPTSRRWKPRSPTWPPCPSPPTPVSSGTTCSPSRSRPATTRSS